jgi:YD repeat-containing protein
MNAKRATAAFVALLGGYLIANMAHGETVYYYDASGANEGARSKVGNTYFYRGKTGATEMSARPLGDSTLNFYSKTGAIAGTQRNLSPQRAIISGSDGRTVGSVSRVGDTLYYYASDGRLLGTERRIGSTVYFYDSTGRITDRATVLNGAPARSSDAKSTPTPAVTPLFVHRLLKQESQKK